MRAASLSILVVFTALCLRASAQSPNNPQTLAAAADAQENLRSQVLSTPIAQNLTVGDLLGRVGGMDELSKTLHTAQQIGGARWLDPQTVQVRLLIEGAAVAQTLTHIVDQNAAKSPLPPEVIRRSLARWRDRTFSATGTGTASADVTRLQPPPNDAAWASVGDADCQKALAMARDNASERLIDSLRPIEFNSDKTIGDALAIPQVNHALRAWLNSRPVASVEFHEDLSVRLALAASPDELCHMLQGELSKQSQIPPPATQAGWDWLQKQVESRVAPAVGTGVAQPTTQPAAAALQLPLEPPPWATRQLEAEATATTHGSKLHTARAAETIALEQLRHQVEALPLTNSMTIGQAANHDPRIEKALLRALNRAHPYQVDYKAQDAVTVHVSLSGGDLWSALSSVR